MRIGVDFDNTIVCFDPLFYQAALAKKLIPPETPATKLAVRNCLRAQGNEALWTELQGLVYGELIRDARPYEGVQSFFSRARSRGHDVCIISHKTERPALGHPFDLHASASAWLDRENFFAVTGVSRDRVFFETSIPLKLERIRKEKCEVFIDDLLEFLLNADFPSGVERILFSPVPQAALVPFRQARSWAQIEEWML